MHDANRDHEDTAAVDLAKSTFTEVDKLPPGKPEATGVLNFGRDVSREKALTRWQSCSLHPRRTSDKACDEDPCRILND